MIKLPRMTDRYRIKVGGAVFTIAPLTKKQKIEIRSCTKVVDGEIVPDIFEMQCLYLKHGLKDIEGVSYSDGEPYVLAFENDELTDECIDELLHLPQKSELMTASWQFLNGAPDEVINPITGERLEGVEFEIKTAGKSKGD